MTLDGVGRAVRPRFEETIQRLAQRWPWADVGDETEPDELAPVTADAGRGDRHRAHASLDLSVTPAEVTAAAMATGTLVAMVGCLLFVAPAGSASVVLGLGTLGAGTAIAFAGPELPTWLARARRRRALGAAPALVTQLAVELSVSPAVERAVDRAVARADGTLGRSLARHRRLTADAPRSAIAGFATEWEPWFPALSRACDLLERAARVDESERTGALERARDAVQTAARDRVEEFAGWIRGPATALYAFGVMVPLALVSLLPALRATGVSVGPIAIAVLFDLLLPAALLAATVWLLARRPAAVRRPTISRTHPSLPDRRWPVLVVGLVAGVGTAAATAIVAPVSTAPIVGLGVGVGVALVLDARPGMAVRETVRELERSLPDVLRTIGARVERGDSVETALDGVTRDDDGPLVTLLADATRRQRRLGVDVERAFRGPHGAATATPSYRLDAAVDALVLATRIGRPAGDPLQALGEQFEALATLEAETRRSLQRVTTTLAHTATVFAPLVGGATVALARTMGRAEGLATGGDAGALAIVVGVYVLLLAVILVVLAVCLARGLDRTLVQHRVGEALVVAPVTYVAALVGTGLLV